MRIKPSNDLDALLRELQSRVPVDAAELLARQSPAMIERALQALPEAFATRVNAHLLDSTLTGVLPHAEPRVVADLMEPARAVFTADDRVEQAIEFLRGAGSVSDITYLYIVDAQQRLTGLVVMRDLLLARPGQALGEVMLREPFRFGAETDLAEAIHGAFRRHYPVYPVCDAEGRLLGIVRGWKLFERQAIEISAQSGRMVGVDQEERVDTGFWTAFRLRHPWLQFNLLTGFLVAFVVGSFEDTIAKIVVLAAFLPVLAGQSGNNGAQALAITLRGYTLGDLDQYPLRRLLLKETLLGLLNGLLTGVVAGLAMWWSAGHNGSAHAPLLGAVVAIAMTGSCMLSGVFGVIVPLALKRFGADPATASHIFLTTGTEIASMGLMLLLATMLVL